MNVRKEIHSLSHPHTLMNDYSIPKFSYYPILPGYKDKRRESISGISLQKQKHNNCGAYDLRNTMYQLKVGEKKSSVWGRSITLVFVAVCVKVSTSTRVYT